MIPIPGKDALASQSSRFTTHSRLLRYGTGIVVALVVAFVFLLVYSNYRASTKIKEAYIERLKGDAERETAGVDAFFGARKRDLEHDLAASPEVAGFHANRALGMSMEYGLNLSLGVIKELFKQTLLRQDENGKPLYRGIALLDAGKSLQTQFGILTERDIQIVSTNTARRDVSIVISSQRDGFLGSAPVNIKDQYEGEVVAYFGWDALKSQSMGKPADLALALLPFGEIQQALPLFDANTTQVPYMQIALARGQPKAMNVVSTTIKGQLKYYAVYGRKLQNASFECISFVDVTDQYGNWAPWHSLLGMTLLSVVILGGAFFIVQLNTRTRMLHVRLAESLSHQQEVEAKNSQMELEIASRKRAEEEKEQLEIQLRQSQKLEAVGRLAGGVAHDFNNLLQVIQGNHELAITELKPDHPAHGSLLEIGGAADRAASLVKQLLTFSRRAPFHPQTLDVAEIVTSMGKMIRRLIGEQIELDIQTAAEPQVVSGDRTQLEQAFVNLCVNARDAIAHHGKIAISTRIVKQCILGQQCAVPAPATGYVCIRVKDTGSGIPREIQDRIYEPFFTTKEVGKGTGLGLSTVYSIVERHHGHIHLESDPGKGTAFSVYLPLHSNPVPAQTLASQPPPARGCGQTILLAEDETAVRCLAVRILSLAGFRILEAGDGEEAISLFEQNSALIDCAVLDVIMPRKSGAAVYHAIRGHRPDMPVLFTSGYTFDNFDEGQLPSDAALLSKPYHPSVLLNKINELMDAKGR